MSSFHTVSPPPTPPDVHWSHRRSVAAAGLSLARESGHLLAWDRDRWLTLFDRAGRVQAQSRWPATPVGAVIAEDGSVCAVADRRGTVAWLSRDLTVRWQGTFPDRLTGLATDALGHLLAVADASGRVRFLDGNGTVAREALSPRPIHLLAFVPERPVVMAAADFGLITAVNLSHGEWTWKDNPVTHVAALGCSGDGSAVFAACFSDGVRRYGGTGLAAAAVAVPEPARLAALSYDGRRLLVAGSSDTVYGFNGDGSRRFVQSFGQPIVALALAALGDRLAVGLADGRVLWVEVATW
jgi:hypothetical protein